MNHKKSAVAKTGTKKSAPKKTAAKKASVSGAYTGPPTHARKRSNLTIQPTPSGYQGTKSGLLVPETLGTVIPPSKFNKGLNSARDIIKESIDEFAKFMAHDMEISEIELSISFNANGEFLGFGIGGAASVKIKIRPC